MSNNLSVAVTADVTDLQVKSAVAKAEVRSLTAEMNALAKAAAAGMGPEVGPALQAVAGDLVKAKSEAAALSAEFKELTATAEGVGNVVEEIGGKFNSFLQFTGIAAAVEGFNLLRESIEKVVEDARQVSLGADTLGVTVEQFQAMAHAAEEAGVGADTLAHASEKLEVVLNEARNGSGAAIEKLYTLGITSKQIQDPLFGIIQLLGVEKERLENGSTAVEARNALLQVLGTRMASAIGAIKEFDGSEAGVQKSMGDTNGLSEQQVQRLKEVGSWWGAVGKSAENAAGKLVVAGANALNALSHARSAMDMQESSPGAQAAALGPDPAATAAASQQAAQARVQAAQAAEQAEQTLNRQILQQEMDNAKAGVAAFKEGSQQKLEQLRTYAAAAQQFFGSDTVDVVVKANQEIIAQQRAVTDHQAAELQKQRSQLQDLESFGAELNSEIMVDRQRLDLESAKADAEYVKESKKLAKELYEGWEQVYTEINSKHAALLKQENADAAKATKEESKAWQGVVGEIEGAESSMVSNILSKRKSLSQSLMALGAQLVTSEIANDLKAVTTRMLLHNTAANQQKALEQGGLLYHMFASNASTQADITNQARQTSATASSQSAQTSAVMAGNIARVTSTTAAAATSQATASATGSKTIMQDAAKAFSGVYASVAQIPYVGWILAPIAASAAYAGVAAYEGLASLDTGTNYVPRDMVANIHEGEAVVPRQYNPAANPGLATAGAGGSGGGDTFGDFHQTNHFHGAQPTTEHIIAALARATRNGHPAAMKLRRR